MKAHTHMKGEYSQEESLQIDKDNLSNAKVKLSRKLNPTAREHYNEEVTHLTQQIKDRTILIGND